MNGPGTMLAKKLHELRQAAFFVRAKVIVNVPAKVILAEIVIVFATAADDGIERVQAETFRRAQLPAQAIVFDPTAQRPDGIDERQPGEFIPRGAQVPEFVLTRSARKIKRRIANQQGVIG